jgi:hypothetical protein
MRADRGMQMETTVAVRTRNAGESEWRTGESEWSTRSEVCERTNARFFPHTVLQNIFTNMTDFTRPSFLIHTLS